MSDSAAPGSPPTPPEALATPVLEQHGRYFSLVWLVPIVAMLIGGWLVFKNVTERGPRITIDFKTAEGLEAGKTKISFKNVDIGLVQELHLSKDASRVVVTAQLTKEIERYLTENTSFWVVRPRVAASRVSGLSTLFSGAYIAMDPGPPGAPRSDFVGLEEPPIVASGDPGRRFTLNAERLGSLDIGSPLYFRQIPVGEVVGYNLAEDGSKVIFQVFVHAPYHRFVRRNTRFWNASGIDFKLDAAGLSLETESLVSVALGGIAFDVLEQPATQEEIAPGEHVFTLFKDRQVAQERIYSVKNYYLLHFGSSVRGLAVGAPVEFRGIALGKVVDIRLDFDPRQMTFNIPVLIEMEPERINVQSKATGDQNGEQVLEHLVEKGLRAQLRASNLLTGQQYVALDFFSNAAPAKIVRSGEHPQLPIMPPPLEEIGSKVGQLVAKLERLPIDEIGRDLRETVKGARRIANSRELEQTLAGLAVVTQEIGLLASELRNTVVPAAGATLQQAQRSLNAAENALRSDSPLQQRARNALGEIERAARSLRELSDYLERQPQSLIWGRQEEKP